MVHTMFLVHGMLRQGNYFELQARLHYRDPGLGVKGKKKSISNRLIPGSLSVNIARG